jgi:murein tripeptide amidase MpaA
MARLHVVITGRDVEAMADLVRRYRVDVARHTVEALARGAYRVHAHASAAQIRVLRASGYRVARREDLDRRGKTRQKEVNPPPRKGRAAKARAVSAATRYLNVIEVEAAIAAAAAPPNDGFTTLIPLPHTTWENRTCHALRIGHGAGASRPGIYLLGGVHAREWGSPDILVNFVQQLTDAYRTGAGVTLGGRAFSAAQIRTVVETKDVYVFAQANPDGRQYSMTREAMWRKNRRPAPAGQSATKCIGVDINRNYDFLWDYPKYFAPGSPIANSTDPCDHDVYIGPAAASEPATKNAVSMFDQHPNIRYFIDLHSYSEDILYAWGDDEDQSATPAMNFRNPTFDGKRGIKNDTAYKEYNNPTPFHPAYKEMRQIISEITAALLAFCIAAT